MRKLLLMIILAFAFVADYAQTQNERSPFWYYPDYEKIQPNVELEKRWVDYFFSTDTDWNYRRKWIIQRFGPPMYSSTYMELSPKDKKVVLYYNALNASTLFDIRGELEIEIDCNPKIEGRNLTIDVDFTTARLTRGVSEKASKYIDFIKGHGSETWQGFIEIWGEDYFATDQIKFASHKAYNSNVNLYEYIAKYYVLWNKVPYTDAVKDSLAIVYAKKGEESKAKDYFKFGEDGQLSEFHKTSDDNMIFELKDGLFTAEMPNGDRLVSKCNSGNDLSPLVKNKTTPFLDILWYFLEGNATLYLSCGDVITHSRSKFQYKLVEDKYWEEYEMKDLRSEFKESAGFLRSYDPFGPSIYSRLFIPKYNSKLIGQAAFFADGKIELKEKGLYPKFCATFKNGDELEIKPDMYHLIHPFLTYRLGEVCLDMAELDEYSSISDIEGIYINARVTTTKNTIDVYDENGEKDEFESQKETAQSQAELKRAEEERAKKKAYVNGLIQKYGKANVDKLLQGTIAVGMPFDLLKSLTEQAIETNGKEAFFGNFDLCIDHGSSKCYDFLFWFTLDEKRLGGNRGYFWTTNGKVSSVVVY